MPDNPSIDKVGTAGDDQLFGGDFNDALSGGDGNDVLGGGEGGSNVLMVAPAATPSSTRFMARSTILSSISSRGRM